MNVKQDVNVNEDVNLNEQDVNVNEDVNLNEEDKTSKVGRDSGYILIEHSQPTSFFYF